MVEHKICQLCHKDFVREIWKTNRGEPLSHFTKRQFCSRNCAGKVNITKRVQFKHKEGCDCNVHSLRNEGTFVRGHKTNVGVKRPDVVLRNKQEDFRKKVSLGQKGKKYSFETKQKIGAANHWNGNSNRIRLLNLTDNPGRYAKSPSKPQKYMFNQIQKVFPQEVVLLNYKVNKKVRGHYYLDIAIPRFKINFEYDGNYWHSQEESISRDFIRDDFLKNNGWHIIRVRGD